MPLITLPFTFVPNTVAVPGQVNSDFSTIVNLVNGNLDNTNFSSTGTNLSIQKIASVDFASSVRVYTTTGNPTLDSAGGASGTATVYVGPNNGDQLSLWSGSAWLAYTLTEQSFSVGALSNGLYDVVVAPSAGIVGTPTTVAWSGNTPPGRTLLNGTYVITANNQQRVLATIFVTGGVTKDYPGSRWISNLYNPIVKPLYCADTTGSWTYGTNSPREANAKSTDGVSRVSFVSWNGANHLSLVNSQPMSVSVLSSSAGLGIGIGSGTAPTVMSIATEAVAGSIFSQSISYAGLAPIGQTFAARVENAVSGSGVTFTSTQNGVAAAPMTGSITT